MVDIMGALATASHAIKLAQDLRGIDRAIDAAEYKLKIADLTSALSDIKMALTDAKEDLASRDSEIEKLKKQFRRLAETVEFDGFKYDRGPDDKPKGSAYCPVCVSRRLGPSRTSARPLSSGIRTARGLLMSITRMSRAGARPPS